jgi:hypothetical protein
MTGSLSADPPNRIAEQRLARRSFDQGDCRKQGGGPRITKLT